MEKDELAQARERIDSIDRQLARLFEERMRAVARVACYKAEHGMEIFDREREEQVVAAGGGYISDEKLRPYYVDFLRHVTEISKRYQSMLLGGGKDI